MGKSRWGIDHTRGTEEAPKQITLGDSSWNGLPSRRSGANLDVLSVASQVACKPGKGNVTDTKVLQLICILL